MTDEPIRKNLNPRENPCHICGNSDYIWGEPITSNNEPDRYLFFREFGTTREDGDRGLYARMCKVCGNVQFFYE